MYSRHVYLLVLYSFPTRRSSDLLPDGTRNDVALAGLNHKMGYRGTVNTVLNFGERTGAVGWLVGAPNQGLAADRKSTRLNSSHVRISYAVFCLKKKKQYSTPHNL